MTTKYTQQDVADALTVFITSGSASGDEAMRKYCLSRVKLFADADRLRAENIKLGRISAGLAAACEAFLEAQDSPAPRDLLTLAAIQASRALAEIKR